MTTDRLSEREKRETAQNPAPFLEDEVTSENDARDKGIKELVEAG